LIFEVDDEALVLTKATAALEQQQCFRRIFCAIATNQVGFKSLKSSTFFLNVHPGEGSESLSPEQCGGKVSREVCRRKQVWRSHVSFKHRAGSLLLCNICRKDVGKCEARYKCDLQVISQKKRFHCENHFLFLGWKDG
jgi:hypothetical protein